MAVSQDALSHADLARERSGGDEATFQHRRSLQTDDLAQFVYNSLTSANRVQAQALAAQEPVAVQVVATDELVGALGHAVGLLAFGDSCNELKALQLQLVLARRHRQRGVAS